MTVGRMGLGVAPHSDFVPAEEQKQAEETAKHVSTWAKKLEAQRAKTYNPRLLTASFKLEGEQYTARFVPDEKGRPRLEAVKDDAYFPSAQDLGLPRGVGTEPMYGTSLGTFRNPASRSCLDPLQTHDGRRVKAVRTWCGEYQHFGDNNVIEIAFEDGRVEEWQVDGRTARREAPGFCEREGIPNGMRLSPQQNIDFAEKYGHHLRTLYAAPPPQKAADVPVERYARALFNALPDAQAFISSVSDHQRPGDRHAPPTLRERMQEHAQREKIADKVWERDDQGFRTACMQLATKLRANL